MPKYLAINYLAEVSFVKQVLVEMYVGLQALKKKHALLERMLLVPPQHLEHVDSYIHKGDIPDCSYACPWKSGIAFCCVVLLCLYCNLCCEAMCTTCVCLFVCLSICLFACLPCVFIWVDIYVCIKLSSSQMRYRIIILQYACVHVYILCDKF